MLGLWGDKMRKFTDWSCDLLPMMGGLVTTADETAKTLILLNEKFGLSRFCMTPEFNCENDSVASFIARRNRACTEVSSLLPPGIQIVPGASINLIPGLSEERGLKKLLLPTTDELPIRLPFFFMKNDNSIELNRLLYHSPYRICFLSFDSYLNFYSKEDIARWSNLENVSFQFNYRSLASPEARSLLKRLIDRNATIRFGTELNSYGKACYYELDYYLELASNYFSEYERGLLFSPLKNEQNSVFTRSFCR